MITSNLARSRATAMSCQSSGLVQSYPLPVRGPDQPSRPNPAWGLKAQNHIKCIFVMAALSLLRCLFLRSQDAGMGGALGDSRSPDIQTPLPEAEVARLQDTEPGTSRKGTAKVPGLGRRYPHPLATALALVTDTVFSVAIGIACALTHAAAPSRLPGLCLDAVIDGAQTGPRVRLDIS